MYLILVWSNICVSSTLNPHRLYDTVAFLFLLFYSISIVDQLNVASVQSLRVIVTSRDVTSVTLTPLYFTSVIITPLYVTSVIITPLYVTGLRFVPLYVTSVIITPLYVTISVIIILVFVTSVIRFFMSQV